MLRQTLATAASPATRSTASRRRSRNFPARSERRKKACLPLPHLSYKERSWLEEDAGFPWSLCFFSLSTRFDWCFGWNNLSLFLFVLLLGTFGFKGIGRSDISLPLFQFRPCRFHTLCLPSLPLLCLLYNTHYSNARGGAPFSFLRYKSLWNVRTCGSL